MLTSTQCTAAGHFCTKPAWLTISTKVKEWFDTSYDEHLEILMTDPGVTGLVVILDGYVTVLEGPPILRHLAMRSIRILLAYLGNPVEFNIFSFKDTYLCCDFVEYN